MRILHLRGPDTVRIKERHADHSMVLDGRVRELDRLGNNADQAADFGRRRVGDAVIDVRRDLLGFVVNHHGHDGTAPDPLVWSAGALTKRYRMVHQVRNRAFLPFLLLFFAEDIAHRPHTTGLLVQWVSSLGSLHWLSGGLDRGVGGFSFVELLILHEFWAGERHGRSVVMVSPLGPRRVPLSFS